MSIIEALQFDFFQHALAAGLLASILCGVIGSLVVVNRLVFLAGGVAHAAYGGVGLAVILGLPILPVTSCFAVFAAMIMAMVTLKVRERADTVIGVIWAAGMAFGVVLLDLAPGYNVDLMSYLFGSIMAVATGDLWLMGILSAAVPLVVLVFYRGLSAMSFDEDFARARGVPVNALYYLLIGMVALCVVTLIRVAGLILVIAMLTIPPFIAERRARSLGRMMIASTLLGAMFCLAGLWLAFRFDLTSGAAIIAVSSVTFFLSLAIPQRSEN
ncbi:metal ABC transporter permease [Salidesulfovibrio brasiliensis]|uniref:metal ABC transporter permease n=1 Tax=Salidesulfovibrio brasiliensis TaxID=221711 RepID=UPI0009F8C724|nr:iron chelate uptake ABC transporter family permease subunit [Salidesulfovibrio brasiliensis]